MGSAVTSEGGYVNIENPSEEISKIEAENPAVVSWALETTAKATDKAQYIVTIMNNDFQTIQPQFPAEQ